MIELADTHCHIHFPDYELDPDATVKEATRDGVTRLMAVGCTLPDSRLAVEFAARHDNVWATIGLHPHEGAEYVHDHLALQQFRDLADKPKVVAIGETGLDYHYLHSSKEDQKKLLRFQLDLATEHNLPLIFHVREAFDDFWEILDGYRGLRGVVHSFSSDTHDLENILSRGFYVGLNGIMTFTRDEKQLEAAKRVPLNRLLLETDAPFLTPVPFRGKICEPKHVRVTAEFLAKIRGESLEELAAATSANAKELFKLV
jgi:TatD DNase family protein